MKLRANIKQGHGLKRVAVTPTPANQPKKRLAKLSEKEEEKKSKEQTV
jgi:hypothetical protein